MYNNCIKLKVYVFYYLEIIIFRNDNRNIILKNIDIYMLCKIKVFCKINIFWECLYFYIYICMCGFLIIGMLDFLEDICDDNF